MSKEVLEEGLLLTRSGEGATNKAIRWGQQKKSVYYWAFNSELLVPLSKQNTNRKREK